MNAAIFHHLALPPRLPHAEDANLDEIEACLVDRLVASVQRMRGAPREDATFQQKAAGAWESIRQCLVASQVANHGGTVNKAKLLEKLRQMDVGGALVLHARSQNAALLIHRLSGSADSVTFEVFESSAKNEDVLATDDALQWDFPGNAVAIPLGTFSDEDFQDSIATFLEQASLESTKMFGGHAFKAGAKVYEYRDTASPEILSSLLMAILEDSGRKIPLRYLRKRVRDDICWLNASKPWRRSPYWLVLRVAVARLLMLALGEEAGRFEYKLCLCDYLANYLGSAGASLTAELTADQVHFLKAKLCRRLVKLDAERSRLRDGDLMLTASLLLHHLAPGFNEVLGKATRRVQSEWEGFKKSLTTVIPRLPKRASPSDLTLRLRVSGEALQHAKAATNRMIATPQPRWLVPPDFNLASQSNDRLAEFARPFLNIAREGDALPGSMTVPGLAGRIRRYLDTGLPLYEGHTEQMSLLILNVMEVWVALDQQACRTFPLLHQFHPVFVPEALDALHLATYTEMLRLQTIQGYLKERIKVCAANPGAPHIFRDPSPGCFAERYYDECPEAEPMRILRGVIEHTAHLKKKDKREEWQRKSNLFEALTRQVNGSLCIPTVDEDVWPRRETHIESRCARCQATRRLLGLRIRIYEHPLPSDVVMAKAVVFELICPSMFSEYRDITWMLALRLASPGTIGGHAPRCLLREYSELSEFCEGEIPALTLASVTKSFLQTHYSTVSLPVEWDGGRDGVCRPNGLKLGYFDSGGGVWPGRARLKLRFSHHFQLQLPPKSPFHPLLSHSNFVPGGEGLSSYEIMASQTSRPPGLNQHEFVAFETLMSGFARRWLSILVELGSTNLNWSSEAVTSLLTHLTLHCGPSSDQNDPLRLIHAVFREPCFVEKLLEQVKSRLQNLAATASWRETNLMDLLITLSLRSLDLAKAARLGPEICEGALHSVLQARDICVRWFRLLRDEIQVSSDISVAGQLQQRALSAALLCRRTFTIHLHHNVFLDKAALETYIESTITIQENMVSDMGALPRTMLQHLVSSIKLAQKLQSIVSQSIRECRGGLRDGLKHFWPGAERLADAESIVDLDQHPGWVYCDIPETEAERHQVVHLSLLLGTLLVNGKPVGKLPQDSRDTFVIRDLFGDQPLRVFQSPIPGMLYTLTYKPNGFTIHLGYQRNEMIVLAEASRNRRFRYIPRDWFHHGSTWDLPSPLVNDRIHWLDLWSGEVYLTPLANKWALNSRHSTWTLNVEKGTCRRQRHDKFYEVAVDPHSPLFQRVGKILNGLAPRGQLLVSQPSKPYSNLEVYIQALQLMFFVNRNCLLYSPQLDLEVDENQDAGTWYGLEQKLVCRDVDNPFQRTILVPLGGDFTIQRWMCHVRVNITRSKQYGKFVINDTLGRVDCASDPELVYAKALLHASTSFMLPDPLTGRTGTEESLHWLQSGACRPWTVLGDEGSILARIAKLTPIREYYPPGREVMKMDKWDENLTWHIQHPLYRPVVDGILALSKDLQTFATSQGSRSGGATSHHLPPFGEAKLNMRALIRRQLYERRNASGDREYLPALPETADQRYLSRDRSSSTEKGYAKAMEVARLLRTRPERFDTPSDLAVLFAKGNLIGGYGFEYDKVSLSDRLHTNIRENWGALVEYLSRSGSKRFSSVFLMSALSFRKLSGEDDALIKALVAFAIFPELQALRFPPWPCYFNFRPKSAPALDEIVKLLSPFRLTPAEDEAAEELNIQISARQQRKAKSYARRSAEDCHYFAKFILAQWPCPEPNASNLERTLLLKVGAALKAIQPEWLRLYQNRELSVHLTEVQNVLDQRHSDVVYNVLGCSQDPPKEAATTINGRRLELHEAVPELDSNLLAKRFDQTLPFIAESWVPLGSIPRDERSISRRKSNRNAVASNARPQITASVEKRHAGELREIARGLQNSESMVRQTYARGLLQSIQAFENRHAQKLAQPFLYVRDLSGSQIEVLSRFGFLRASLERPTRSMSRRQIEWLKLGGLWPAITTVSLLEQLRSTASPQLGRGMQEGLVSLGLAITKLQRDMRLNDCVLAGDMARFQDEEANSGHDNWDPVKHPDWLLLEIEANLLIRPGQVDVARATISPHSGTNSVLQMNMGQGKTSCIMPMVAASMADKKSLVRVIVPKALLLQTAQLFQSRLGGMLNRQICHIPFSRRTPTGPDTTRLYYQMHSRVMIAAGVMLCLPEHNLSFMLSGQQRILDNKMDEAKPMTKMQTWLRSVCRDLLDESDYTLATRTQLIYPSGSQMSVDGHPHRWLVVEAVLGLVDRHLYGLAASFPRSIEVVRGHAGGFPFIYFVRRDAEDELIRRVAADVCKGLGDILPIRSLSRGDRIAIRDFLAPGPREHGLRPSTLERLRSLSPDRPQVRQTVYLLRGLLVNRILIMALRKRWNVQYGLRPGGDPVAVPFHAKGVPSEQSEWGHPDVAILFTCLTFYYDGIGEDHLRQALARVLKSDDPSTEYAKWAHSSDEFPASLRVWNTINIEDDLQVRDIWKAVRYQVVVIDYYLNHFVFPLHAKQFKAKLQSSGWDIPLFSLQANVGKGEARPPRLTTGFSGTNDNRTMLPLTIQQADLPTLSHTNAEVLTYLLHDRSRGCEVITDVRGGRATERDLLFMLKRMNIRVLIDAGAQILEMDNETLAKTWLSIDQRCNAALFFDSANKPFVITKLGRKTSLLASPYADSLHDCLIYLDEAHTRGTDLKLPLDAHGALTVGQGQSKDHTVQAAMRLRQLGTSQKITFLVPPEVHQVIVDLTGRSTQKIDSHDVIRWLLDNSCDGIEQLQPLYFSQGIDYCRRTQAAVKYPNYLTEPDDRARYVACIQQNELQTLQEMYEPKKTSSKASDLKQAHPKLAAFADELHLRRKGFQDTGRAVHGSALQEVEQEREVASEAQVVRQKKTPPRHDALRFPGVHWDIQMFARTGRLPIDSNAVLHVFRLLSLTDTGRKHRVSKTGRHSGSNLFVSAEFLRTVKPSATKTASDSFLRPVSWVLWSRLVETAVVLIPEEAEHVICMMRAGEVHPDIHLITYASAVTRQMLSFSNLDFFSMPPLPSMWAAPQWLKSELGLLSGRLYFEWQEHESLCEFLGVHDELRFCDEDENDAEDVQDEQDDGDVDADNDNEMPSHGSAKKTFCPRPLIFLQDWLTVRRKGQDIVHTAMGFLTQGKPLQASHPFFGGTASAPLAVPVAGSNPSALHSRSADGGNNDDVEEFDGVDDMGANVGDIDDDEEMPIYEESELDLSENSGLESPCWSEEDASA